MSEFTINDNTLAEVIYEIDEREIYNDIRSKVGLFISETLVDPDDPFYNWQIFTRYVFLEPGETKRARFGGLYVSASDWELVTHSAYSYDPIYYFHYSTPYYDYTIVLETMDGDFRKDVVVTNTGILNAMVRYVVKYKYLAAETITHEDLTPLLVTVRAVDETSIRKYGRRVMNLTWSEGTEEGAMRSLVNNYLTRYKEPSARLIVTVKGITDTLRTQIITREISDRLTVVCANLGLNADFFINSISISFDPAGIPLCTWGVEEQRAEELLTLFLTNTSFTNGPHITGS